MQKFTKLQGLVAPMDRENVDTDAIIPKQFLKSIKKTGFGVNLFDEWRYLDHGEPGIPESQRKPNPDFVLNQPRYAGASILLARKNFGCGSSREHAPWALADYGFKTIIAPSFADIFYGNAINNGMVPVRLKEEEVEALFQLVAAQPGIEIDVDLEANQVRAGELSFSFEIDEFRRYCLLNGLDAIGLTLQHEAAISAFEAKQPSWI